MKKKIERLPSLAHHIDDVVMFNREKINELIDAYNTEQEVRQQCRAEEVSTTEKPESVAEEIYGKGLTDLIVEKYDEIKEQKEKQEEFTLEELDYLKACTSIVYDEWKINGFKPKTIMVEKLRKKLSSMIDNFNK